MIDAEIPFSAKEMALAARDVRKTPLSGLGLAILTSAGLWGLLALALTRLL